MGAPKMKYASDGKKSQDNSTTTESQQAQQQTQKDKQLIEQMKKSISHKLKDPELAKKAAQLIAELLEQAAGKK